jgi:hypothetical protein
MGRLLASYQLDLGEKFLAKSSSYAKVKIPGFVIVSQFFGLDKHTSLLGY